MVGDVACIDFGGSSVKLSRWRHGVRADATVLDRTGPDVLTSIAGTIAGWRRIDAASIAVPGVVDPAGTRLVSAHGKYGWLRGLDLAAWAAEELGVSGCRVHNDARAALQGEVVQGGAAPGVTDAVMLVLGTGIGTAALCDGRLMLGSTGHASILGGHVTMAFDGPECLCGNRGCAEALVGSWALADRARQHPAWPTSPLRLETEIGYREVLGAEAAGDPCAAWLVETALDVWAALLVTLCHLYDPQVAIVSGGPMNAADRLIPPLHDRVRGRLWRGMEPPELRTSTDPTWSVARGLAALTEETP